MAWCSAMWDMLQCLYLRVAAHETFQHNTSELARNVRELLCCGVPRQDSNGRNRSQNASNGPQLARLYATADMETRTMDVTNIEDGATPVTNVVMMTDTMMASCEHNHNTYKVRRLVISKSRVRTAVPSLGTLSRCCQSTSSLPQSVCPLPRRSPQSPWQSG